MTHVDRLIIGKPPGPVVHLLTLGATVQRLEATGGDGIRRNLVLGHATPGEYLDAPYFLGASIGRYANRIAVGRFPLDGRTVIIRTSDRGQHLHGGPDGFDRRVWDVVDRGPTHALLRLVSPDGDQGFPGTLTATAHYEVDQRVVRVTYEATTNAPTVVNLTSHVYLNLDGAGSGTIDGHELRIHADEYTPVDAVSIPLGGHEPVEGTPFDFRALRRIGPAVRDPHPQTVVAGGIDHNYVIRGGGLRPVAELVSRRTNTRLVLRSDQPGLQVFTANVFDGTRRDVDGRALRQGDGIALEPQVFPDSPNHPEWPSPILRPGETYRSVIEWEVTAAPARP